MNSKTPQDLALKIFNKELELQSSNSLAVLNALVELYKEAIEYYEDQKSPIFMNYQERLHRILLQPKVMKMMRSANKCSKAPVKIRSRERGKTHIVTLDKGLRSVEHRSEEVENQDKVVNRIVENQIKRTENVTNKAVSDLKLQESSLSERLLKRKLTVTSISSESSFRSSCSGKDNWSLPQSPSGGFSSFFDGEQSPPGAEQIHERIEKIIEENFNEKTDKITQIKLKYSQISELEMEGGVSERIIGMKKNMANEIEELTKELDGKRKLLIKNVKNELGLMSGNKS